MTAYFAVVPAHFPSIDQRLSFHLPVAGLPECGSASFAGAVGLMSPNCSPYLPRTIPVQRLDVLAIALAGDSTWMACVVRWWFKGFVWILVGPQIKNHPALSISPPSPLILFQHHFSPAYRFSGNHRFEPHFEGVDEIHPFFLGLNGFGVNSGFIGNPADGSVSFLLFSLSSSIRTSTCFPIWI